MEAMQLFGIAACLALSWAPGTGGVAQEVPLDTVIELLPSIGAEGTWNKPLARWDYVPAVLDLRARIANGVQLSDEQWRRALLRSHAIRVRERWPADVPFAVSIEIPAWLPTTEIRLYEGDVAPPVAKGGTTASNVGCGNCWHAAKRRARYQELRLLDPGKQTVSFRAVVERGGPPSVAGVLWRGELAFEVEVVPTFEAALPAAHDEVLDAAVRSALDATIYDGTRLVMGGDVERVPALATTAVSLEFQLCEGTTVRETDTLTIVDRPGSLVSYVVRWKLPPDLTDPARWSLRVRGQSKGALKAWNAERYWDGEIVIPLAEIPRR